VRASRGRVSRPLLTVVAAAVTGPLVGYEIGRHLGSMPDAVMTDAAMQDAGGPASGDVARPAGPERPG
jgi:hypothetical protein